MKLPIDYSPKSIATINVRNVAGKIDNKRLVASQIAGVSFPDVAAKANLVLNRYFSSAAVHLPLVTSLEGALWALTFEYRDWGARRFALAVFEYGYLTGHEDLPWSDVSALHNAFVNRPEGISGQLAAILNYVNLAT